MVAIYRSAAAADPEAAAELAEALGGRRTALEKFTQSLEADLRTGLTFQQAADILRTLCLFEVYEELVKRSGWTPGEYENWLASTRIVRVVGCMLFVAGNGPKATSNAASTIRIAYASLVLNAKPPRACSMCRI